MQVTQDMLVAQSSFRIEEIESSGNQGVVVVEPLEQGYGHTLGNALRRVMLSSLPGAAITSVKFDGVDHQFSTITGVTEDVLELCLNLKLIRIKADTQTAGTLRLEVKGPKVVTGADIESEAGFSVVNPDQHIATLSKGAQLKIEMSVEVGIGYRQAKDQQTTTVGEIMLDALFSPVVQVSYSVEATRVGRRTDFDKLMLKVTTDGSVTPLQAAQNAASILTAQFSQIVNPVVQVTAQDATPAIPAGEQEVLRLTVEELDLPTRIANALRKGGYDTVGTLQGAKKGVVAKVKNLGDKSVELIADALAKKGVYLSE